MHNIKKKLSFYFLNLFHGIAKQCNEFNQIFFSYSSQGMSETRKKVKFSII